LSSIYPAITQVRLTDYKVRVLGAKGGTESKVRVLVEWTDHKQSWATVGISDNVIDASWRALVDALRLELMRLVDKDKTVSSAVRDFSWAV
jgi:2-isopropylmalate synthase